MMQLHAARRLVIGVLVAALAVGCGPANGATTPSESSPSLTAPPSASVTPSMTAGPPLLVLTRHTLITARSSKVEIRLIHRDGSLAATTTITVPSYAAFPALTVPGSWLSMTRTGVYWVEGESALMKLDRFGHTLKVRNMPPVDKLHSESFVVSPDDNRIGIATYFDQGSVVAVRLYTADLTGDTNVHELANMTYPVKCEASGIPGQPCQRVPEASLPIPRAWYGNALAVADSGYPNGFPSGGWVYEDKSGAQARPRCQPSQSSDGTLNRIVDWGPAGMLCLHRTANGGDFAHTIELIQPDGRARVVFIGETAWVVSAAEAPDGSKIAALPGGIYDRSLRSMGTISRHYAQGWLDSNTVVTTVNNIDTELYDLSNLDVPIAQLTGVYEGVVRP